MTLHVWEQVEGNESLSRMPVPGGWIYDVGLYNAVFVPKPKKDKDTNT